MSKIVRYEFMGSWLLFWLMCATVVFAPLAVLYLITGTIQVETEVDDAEGFVAAYRGGTVRSRASR
jgi:hypothetical protein